MRRIYLLLAIGLCAGCFYFGYRMGKGKEEDPAEISKLNRQIDSLRNEWLASQVRTNKLKDDTAKYLAKARSFEALAINREKSTNQLKKRHGKEMQKLVNQISALTDAGLDSFYRARYVFPADTAKNDTHARYSPPADSGRYFTDGNDHRETGQYDSRPELSDSTEGFSEGGYGHDVDRGGVPGSGLTEGQRGGGEENWRLGNEGQKIQAPKELVPWRCWHCSGCWCSKICENSSGLISDGVGLDMIQFNIPEFLWPPGSISPTLTGFHITLPEIQSSCVMGINIFSSTKI